MTERAAELYQAIKTERMILYVSEWAIRLKWTKEEVYQAAEQLCDAGLLSINSAPTGTVLVLTLRGAA